MARKKKRYQRNLKRGSRRWRARQRQLDRLKPEPGWTDCHKVMSRIDNRKPVVSRERKRFHIATCDRNSRFHCNGKMQPRFVLFHGSRIHRNHPRVSLRKKTCNGIAFPVRLGSRPSFGVNQAPRPATVLLRAAAGCSQSNKNLQGWLSMVDSCNRQIRRGNYMRNHKNWTRGKSGGRLK